MPSNFKALLSLQTNQGGGDVQESLQGIEFGLKTHLGCFMFFFTESILVSFFFAFNLFLLPTPFLLFIFNPTQKIN